MFGTLGGPELLLILVIALIVFGPRKLPEIGKSMGKMMAEFRRASNDFKRTIEDEVEAEKFATSAGAGRHAARWLRPGHREPTSAAPPAAETTAPAPPEEPVVSREAETPPPSEPR